MEIYDWLSRVVKPTDGQFIVIKARNLNKGSFGYAQAVFTPHLPTL